MKVIVQTAETRTIYRSYEVDAPGVIQAREGSLEGLVPLAEREVSHENEESYASAQKSYLDEVPGRLERYINCED